ncbi:gluconeogenesis factor YvcK family protein [Bacillus fonticola]|uniref:gluconeogenesis factor YvcK family protein n=1 Tax=Bacillus fonticola TaxID=2728853 RepID=UPI001473A1C7|nr:YvcK family protein [Bacillus fonticola]
MSKQKPKVVVIGGGTGLPVLLRGLKHFPIDLTAIVTVADDGGSSGRLREELDVPPPGDIRNVLAALSEVEPLIEEMFQHRFTTERELSGHSLGNLILAAMTSITGNFMNAIQELSKVLNVRGQVLPAANQSVVLHAEMNDGTIITGESQIPKVKKTISRVFLTPNDVQPLPETIRALHEADLIVIGPGSLYTSILPNLLVPHIGEALLSTTAKKIYLCNLMTQAGETHNYTASDHVKAIYSHIGLPCVDAILLHNQSIPTEIQAKYVEEEAQPVMYDRDRLLRLGVNVLEKDIASFADGVVRHDTDKVAQILYDAIPTEVKKGGTHLELCFRNEERTDDH